MLSRGTDSSAGTIVVRKLVNLYLQYVLLYCFALAQTLSMGLSSQWYLGNMYTICPFSSPKNHSIVDFSLVKSGWLPRISRIFSAVILCVLTPLFKNSPQAFGGDPQVIVHFLWLAASPSISHHPAICLQD